MKKCENCVFSTQKDGKLTCDMNNQAEVEKDNCCWNYENMYGLTKESCDE